MTHEAEVHATGLSAHNPDVTSFQVFRRVGTKNETCLYGGRHTVVYVDSVWVTPTGETRPYDNGYETGENKLFVDQDGEVYERVQGFDYCSVPRWVRDSDRKRFERRWTDPARELTGNGLNGCPSGAPWWAVEDERRH